MLTQLKRDKVQIAYIQESHLSDIEHLKLKKMGYTKLYFSSHSSGKRRGVVILLYSAVNFEFISELKDKEGRYIMITGKIDGNLVSLFNVYIPPGSDWSFYKHVLEIMSTKSQGTLICGGDFNIRLNPKIDGSNGKPDTKKIYKKINYFMKNIGLIDAWREKNLTSRDYTHYSGAHNVYSRIDLFLMFKNDMHRVVKCDIGTSTLSDHEPVYLSLNLGDKVKTTLWKLNASILNDVEIKNKLKVEIESYIEYNDNEEVSPVILWDALKAVLRGRIIAISSMVKKRKKQKLLDLEKKLKELQKEQSSSPKNSLKSEILEIRKKIDEINNQDIQKKLLFLKQQYYDSGGRALKLLSYRLRRQQAERTIFKIKNSKTNQIETNLEKIQQCFEEYYQKLYSQPPLRSTNEIDSFLSSLNLPKVTSDQNKKLISKITEEEIRSAIRKLKTGKSPGADGFNSEWYRTMQDQLVPTLMKTFNWTLDKKIIPPSWREALISIIPKENKDRLDCGNYRPVSLLNVDYKLFTSILCRRLEVILPGLINYDQTGFIRQRQTQDNVRKSLLIMKHVRQEKIKTLLISLDAEKAFDSVRWEFLYRVMAAFGFHSDLIGTFSALYSKPTARIKINGDLTKPITLERGTRQGCGASALLFSLFIEPLAQSIRQSKEIKGVTLKSGEQKLALFADDIIIFMTDPTRSLPKLMDLLQDYGSFSGYKINITKTQILKFNYNPPPKIRNAYKWKWESNSIKYLGTVLTKDPSQIVNSNYTPLITKIKSDLQRWNEVPFLGLYSRVESIRMNILPRLLYLFQCLPTLITQKQFDEWDRLLLKYIWQNKRARIKHQTMQLPKEKGGFGLPCLRDYYYAAQIRPLICLCSPTYSAGWKDAEGTCIKGIPIITLLSDKKLLTKINLTDDFMYESLCNTWNKLIHNGKLENVSRILRWCAYDSDFKPNALDNKFKSWVSKGLTTYYSFIHKGAYASFEFL